MESKNFLAILVILLSLALFMALLQPGSETLVYGSNLIPVMEFPKHEESSEKSLLRFSIHASSRRLMIGSRVPLCTYNECKGCRFKCSAEQLPVDESDPINSAYRYRCQCRG